VFFTVHLILIDCPENAFESALIGAAKLKSEGGGGVIEIRSYLKLLLISNTIS